MRDSSASADPYNLNRFLQAQEGVYEEALRELEQGRKRSHWMWFIFPQREGLGSSAMSQRYAIKSVEEARAYLDHSILGARLAACAKTLLRLEGLSASQIFDFPDNRKLRSCATLFASVSPPASVFHRLLDKYFEGKGDR